MHGHNTCITDRHGDGQYLVPRLQQQAGGSTERLLQSGPKQSAKQLPEPVSNASSQQLLPEQGEEDQQLQLHEQQEPVVPMPARGAGMLPSIEDGEECNARQLVASSLHPYRLWAFLGLGIPGGLASSVQSAAYEVTTAMAGVLGEDHICNTACGIMFNGHVALGHIRNTDCIGRGSSMLHRSHW